MFLILDHFFIPCVPLPPHTKGQMQGNIIWFFVCFVVVCRFCCYCPFSKNSTYIVHVSCLDVWALWYLASADEFRDAVLRQSCFVKFRWITFD